MTATDTVAPPRRRILFITGTRADYGKMKSIIRVVHDDEQLDYAIFVTGMHMLQKYGRTWQEIEKDGFTGLFLHFNQDYLTDFLMDRVLADTIRGLSHYVAENPVDLIVVHGDRVEALAGALVGSLNGVLVAHVEGGEVSGTVDELLRHAITKMSHLHFVSNDGARARGVVRLGEYPEKVFVIGSGNVDIMMSSDLPSLDAVRAHYEIDPTRPYGVFVMHPVVGEAGDDYLRTRATLEALAAHDRYFVVLYPNNDPGSDAILRAVREAEASSAFRVLPSLRFEAYLTLLRHAGAIVGNSSSGIHEAPVYGVPTINVGSRQQRRFAHQSIIDVPFESQRIVEALDAVWGTQFPPTMHFGTGVSGASFVEVIHDAATWQTQVLKQFMD